MRLAVTTGYKVSALLHFVVTFVIVGFAIVSLVQGIRTQFAGSTMLAFTFYIVTPMLVFVSYLSYKKAHYKLHVLAMARA